MNVVAGGWDALNTQDNVAATTPNTTTSAMYTSSVVYRGAADRTAVEPHTDWIARVVASAAAVSAMALAGSGRTTS